MSIFNKKCVYIPHIKPISEIHMSISLASILMSNLLYL